MNVSDTLKVTTPTDREVVITRVFNAPRQFVFDTMTKPELLKRWLLGPPGWEMVVCELDAKAGGSFRHVWRNADGAQLAMSGVHREVVPNERVVRTESFDMGCDAQMGEQVATLVLTEQGGRTTLTLTVLYPTKEARDAAVASGMDKGLAAGYSRLDEILGSMTQ